MNLPLFEYLSLIQQSLQKQGLDGWLLYDFRAINPVMLQLLSIPKEQKLTRRLYVWVPAQGLPVLLRHQIEHSSVASQEIVFSSLGPSQVQLYSDHRQLSQKLDELLKDAKKIAMEVSFQGKLPYLSCVDLGTVQAVESRGIEVCSSAAVAANVLARWDQEGLDSHLRAARALEEEVSHCWRWIHEALCQGRLLNEYQIQQHLQQQLENRGMKLSDPAIIAINAASADAHYVPTVSLHQELEPNQVLLIDVWCKENKPLARYADICRMAFTGSKPTALHHSVFEAVKDAQQAVFKRLQEPLQDIKGCDLDKIARASIEKTGFGSFFIHRLGHSIDLQCHGSGTHLDDYETCDDRPIVSRTCFSVEPGIYLEGQFGVRLESDVYVDSLGKCHVTGGMQTSWQLLDPSMSAPHCLSTSPLSITL